MLPHGEDEGVVDGEAVALGLRDVEVVALGVGGWVADYEVVGGVGAGVREGKGEGEGVGVLFYGVLVAVPLANRSEKVNGGGQG